MAVPSSLRGQFLHTHMMNNRGFSCIELLVATAFLAVAYTAIAREVRASENWKQSGILAARAINQAKRHQLKEIK